MGSSQSAQICLPLLSLFRRYIHRALRRHFCSVLMAGRGGLAGVDPQRPLIVYLNHASWWDPLISMWLGWKLFSNRPQYGPIDAPQLERYPFFRWLGFFGVEKASSAGARTFLRVAGQVLSESGSMLWITPQGRFADVRERPPGLSGGIAHLALRVPGVQLLPLALEYGFGQERLPHIFLRFGEIITPDAQDASADDLHLRLESALEAAQGELAGLVCQRDTGVFEQILAGQGGVSRPYDLWRRLCAWVRGERVNLNHSQVS
ncbi:MAG: hypothetical protein RLZZ399_1727 [Verrucomicrobiota bacterium]|jgi:1-acyl-sn-glycerol-3-phosphate acyltransferase